MERKITFTAGNQTITVHPGSCTLHKSVCNQSLQHQEDSADCSLAYDRDVFEFLNSHETIQAVVTDDGTPVFTGELSSDISWTDLGWPEPVKSLDVTISDYTSRLDRKADCEKGFTGRPIGTVLTELLADCGLELDPSGSPDDIIPAVVLDEGASYKSVIDQLVYEYGYSYTFTPTGQLKLFSFSSIPDVESMTEVDSGTILSEPDFKRTQSRNDCVTVVYNNLTKRDNELVYRSGAGYNSDYTVAPDIVQNGVYYPFESSPVVEADQGKVFQNFESGYAESYKKYNGETAYRRSSKTQLVYTRNHILVPDWEGGNIIVDRTEFGFKRASIRLLNTSQDDASVYSISIRAEAWYRDTECTVTSGKGTQPFKTETQYTFDQTTAERLAKTLYQYMTKGKYEVSFRSETNFAPGTFISLDSGMSCFSSYALITEQEDDPETGIYTYTAISIGDASVSIKRTKSITQDIPTAAESQAMVSSLVNGSGTEIGNPDNVTGVSAVAEIDTIRLAWTSIGQGLRNTVQHYEIQLSNDSGTTWADAGTSKNNSYIYALNRNAVGYPEASFFSSWKFRIRAVNVYGKNSSSWTTCDVDVDGYGTWQLQPPVVELRGGNRSVTLIMSQPPTVGARLQYGSVKYGIRIRRPITDGTTWYTPGISGNPYLDTDAYKDSGSSAYLMRSNAYSMVLPLLDSPAGGLDYTLYDFQVVAVNEAGTSNATEVSFTADPLALRDFVEANADIKDLVVKTLSVLSAKMGEITDGSFRSSLMNYWTLSTLEGASPDSGNTMYQGAFRVGDEEEYLIFIPILTEGGRPTGKYHAEFHLKDIVFTSTATQINGTIELKDHEGALERALINPQGIWFQTFNSYLQKWENIVWQSKSGIVTPSIQTDPSTANGSLVITNATMQQRRANGSDIGIPIPSGACVYHFDTDNNDHHQISSITISSSSDPGDVAPVRVDEYTAVPADSVIDSFAPAVIAVAPYATEARSLYGNYSLYRTFARGDVWQVEFWIKYIYSLNQNLFKVGSRAQHVKVGVLTAEPFYNNWQSGDEMPPYNAEVAGENLLCYNNAASERAELEWVSPAGNGRINLGTTFAEGSWYHVGIFAGGRQVKVAIEPVGAATAAQLHTMPSFQPFEGDIEVSINQDKSLVMLDELLVSPSAMTAPVIDEALSAFSANTNGRSPYGSLDVARKHFVLDVDGSDVWTNLFNSESFRNALRDFMGTAEFGNLIRNITGA